MTRSKVEIVISGLLYPSAVLQRVTAILANPRPQIGALAHLIATNIQRVNHHLQSC